MSTHCVTSSRLVLKTSYPQMKAHAGSAVPPHLSLPATTLAASISVVTDLSTWGNLDAQHHTLWALYGFFHLPLFSSLVHVSIYQYFVSIYFKNFIRFYDECVVAKVRTCRSQLFLSSMWVPGMDRSLQACRTSTFTH